MRRPTAHSDGTCCLGLVGRGWLLAALLAHLLIPAFFAGHVFVEHSSDRHLTAATVDAGSSADVPVSEEEGPGHCDLCRLLCVASVANGPVGDALAAPAADAMHCSGSVHSRTDPIPARFVARPASPRAPPIV